MQYYFAPLEGLTDSVYRRLHSRFFPGIHRYYTPFLSPTVHRTLTPKEQRELPQADSLDYCAVPQLLGKCPEDFLWMAGQCAERGYKEVNLNLGCPSGTVTAKGKGSGMLKDPAGLNQFLEKIFSASPLPISVKTRLGFDTTEEFAPLLEIFNRYPICELTIHPRVRAQFYSGAPDMEAFRYAVENSKNPLCYNGDLCSQAQILSLKQTYPQVKAVMIGRALIADPGMLTPGGTTRETLEAFHDALLEAYMEAFGGSRNAMFRMKENWRYMLCMFENSDSLGKQLRKTTDLGQYRSITKQIFHTLPMRRVMQPDW